MKKIYPLLATLLLAILLCACDKKDQTQNTQSDTETGGTIVLSGTERITRGGSYLLTGR